MSELLTIIIFTIIQFIIGLGILSSLNINGKSIVNIALAVLTGLMIFSFLPFILQIIKLPITYTNLIITIVIAAIIANIQIKKSWLFLKDLIKNLKIKPKLYEIPFFLIIAFIFFISAWRCFYNPPLPRDLNSGAEAIAEFTVKEKTMINSVFTVNLESTNNIFKPPFVTSLQIIYKYAGFPFGQIWLSTIFLFFIIFIYGILKEKVHPIIADLLLLFLIAIPEFFAYTFMALFDYANAVFYCITCYFLFEFFNKKTINYLVFAAINAGFATYIRSETPVLIGLLGLLLFVYCIYNKTSFSKIIIQSLIFISIPAFFYIISSYYYIHLLPIAYPVSDQINKHLTDLHPLFIRFSEMNTKLIFSDLGIQLYGYLVYVFIFFFILEVVFCFIPDWIKTKTISKASLYWLGCIFIVYFGIPLIGFLLPLADLMNTTKRSLFKLFPLMIIYLSHNKIVQNLSKKIPV